MITFNPSKAIKTGAEYVRIKKGEKTVRKIIPTKDFIVMELRHKENDKIVLPDNYDKLRMLQYFSVILVGPKCDEVKVGDSIVVDPQAVIRFQKDGQDYFLTREENVGAVIREVNKVTVER